MSAETAAQQLTNPAAPTAAADIGNVLAIDTTFAACSAALRLASGPGTARTMSRFEAMPTGHAERLMPMITEIMTEAGATFQDLDAIAVTVGPGSFTGTRVGIAAARGLALASQRPVFGASSLAPIAFAARADRGLPDNHAEERDETAILMVCIDARREQIYHQDFAVHDLQALSQPRICSIEQAAADAANRDIDPGRIIAVGNAAGAVAACAHDQGRPIEVGSARSLPSAADLLEVELHRLAPPRPLYLRPPDAKPQTGKSIARA